MRKFEALEEVPDDMVAVSRMIGEEVSGQELSDDEARKLAMESHNAVIDRELAQEENKGK